MPRRSSDPPDPPPGATSVFVTDGARFLGPYGVDSHRALDKAKADLEATGAACTFAVVARTLREAQRSWMDMRAHFKYGASTTPSGGDRGEGAARDR